jgi:RNA polymerase sigma factor (TIGR02999 family)
LVDWVKPGDQSQKRFLRLSWRQLYAVSRSESVMNPSDVTTLLDGWRRGDRDALERLLPLVYSELRRIAARQLKNERAGHTLQPTALVHEAYLRLADQRQVDWQNQAHFFGVAAQVMRRVLVDHARRRAAAKRGDGAELVSIEQASDIASTDLPVLALDAALDRLEKIDPELAKLVELRAFSGLNNEQAALVLDISPSTVKRELRTAKAWLTNELGYGGCRE